MDDIAGLRRQGWAVEERPFGPLRLPPHVAARYPTLPESLAGFLRRVTSCVNAAETAWFLCEADFCGTSGAAYRWDEWERLSLDAAGGDARWSAEVRAFWDAHFPFLCSVGDGYGYYAILMSGDGFGGVVAGREPEFEQAEVVAASFDVFLASLLRGEVTT